jgi:hypothetical protein
MLSLSKPDSPVWKIGSSDFVSKTTKTKTNTNDFKAFTHTYLHKQDMKGIGYNHNARTCIIKVHKHITSLNTKVHTIQLVHKSTVTRK